QPGVKFHPWVKVIQAVYPFGDGKVVEHGDDALLQMFRQEDIKQFDRVRDAVSCSSVNVFFYQLNGMRIVQHGEQHVDVLNVILHFPTQTRLYLPVDPMVFDFLDGAKVPSDVGNIGLNGIANTRRLQGTCFETTFTQREQHLRHDHLVRVIDLVPQQFFGASPSYPSDGLQYLQHDLGILPTAVKRNLQRWQTLDANHHECVQRLVTVHGVPHVFDKRLDHFVVIALHSSLDRCVAYLRLRIVQQLHQKRNTFVSGRVQEQLRGVMAVVGIRGARQFLYPRLGDVSTAVE